MAEDSPQTDWNDQLRDGDPDAAEVLFDRYALRLVRVAEQHLSRRLAGRLDGEDVVQSVFRTFFRRAEAGEFRIDTSEQLWRLLVRITVLKARAKARHHTAGLRDATAEVGEGASGIVAGVPDGEPGPTEAVALVDQIEALLRGLPHAYARVLELRLAGDSVTEVAERLGLSRQGVHRMLGLLRDRLRAADPNAALPADDYAQGPEDHPT
jgi:RNA polymerase sigma-70 factor (ECF subfamily)